MQPSPSFSMDILSIVSTVSGPICHLYTLHASFVNGGTRMDVLMIALLLGLVAGLWGLLKILSKKEES